MIFIKKLDYIHYEKGIVFIWKGILILHMVLKHEYSADILEPDPFLAVIVAHLSFDNCKIKILKKTPLKSNGSGFYMDL